MDKQNALKMVQYLHAHGARLAPYMAVGLLTDCDSDETKSYELEVCMVSTVQVSSCLDAAITYLWADRCDSFETEYVLVTSPSV